MNSVFFLVLRRMRAPLIVLIAIYAVSLLGLALVPGVDANGRDAGLRFVDLNGDGFDDVLFSNSERYSIHLWNKNVIHS